MSKSVRLVPNQFGAGLTVDATRMEHDLVALANRYNAPLDSDIARRWVENHMTSGFIPFKQPLPAANQVTPQALPWMTAYNPAPVGTAAPDTTAAGVAPPLGTITNPYREKGIFQTGIDPSNAQQEFGNILSYETSFARSKPFLLDCIQLALITDSYYQNPFVWGVDCPAGKVPGEPVDNIVVQVLVDSALSSGNRKAALVPTLVRSFPANQYEVTQPAFQSKPNGMLPRTFDDKVPKGLCITLHPRQPIPENSRVRIVLSVPLYSSLVESPPLDVSSFGYQPWSTFVLSAHTTILVPLEAQ